VQTTKGNQDATEKKTGGTERATEQEEDK